MGKERVFHIYDLAWGFGKSRKVEIEGQLVESGFIPGHHTKEECQDGPICGYIAVMVADLCHRNPSASFTPPTLQPQARFYVL